MRDAHTPPFFVRVAKNLIDFIDPPDIEVCATDSWAQENFSEKTLVFVAAQYNYNIGYVFTLFHFIIRRVRIYICMYTIYVHNGVGKIKFARAPMNIVCIGRC